MSKKHATFLDSEGFTLEWLHTLMISLYNSYKILDAEKNNNEGRKCELELKLMCHVENKLQAVICYT